MEVHAFRCEPDFWKKLALYAAINGVSASLYLRLSAEDKIARDTVAAAKLEELKPVGL